MNESEGTRTDGGGKPVMAPVSLGPWGSLRRESFTLRQVGRRLVQHALGQVPRYHLVDPPILIFTTRRSGSTLLLRLLYTQPGTDYINEPLNLWLPHPHYHRLPHPPVGKFISLSSEEEQRLAGYFDDLLRGRLRLRNQWNPFHPHYSFVVRRLVVKLLNANALMAWFARRFEARILYFVRHPLAVAESIVRQGWARIAEAYIQDPRFRARYLTGPRLQLAQDVLARGTPLQGFVLEWCLENIHPLQIWEEAGAHLLTYEHLVSRPEEESRRLCAVLGLPDPERMYRDIFAPSRTAAGETRHIIAREGPAALVARWQERVPREEMVVAQEILDAFDINLYRADDPYPAQVS